ncbi:MAG TPA: hypothetical protein VFF73_04585, partial [Planctomycetota bacterium]|nr:hypothetical protein [Planctomycetota bacterium]
FRSDAPIDSNIATVLDRAAEKLRASGIDDPSLRFRLYACNERWRYRLVAPFSSSAFGVNSAGRIALNRSDVAADRIYSGERVRTLSGVIAHEATHSLLRQRYGCVTAARLPGWKSEGICDAVAGESSFPMEMGRALLGAGEEDPSPGFSYLKARLMVELLREEGLSWDEIVERRHDEGEVLERLRARLR